MGTRAVIFTHIGGNQYLHNANQLVEFDRKRRPFFEACLRCRNVGIVFIYSSYGVEYFVEALIKDPQPQIPLHVLDGEQRIIDALHIVIDHAAQSVAGSQAEMLKAAGPKFVFVGVRELASHLVRLQRIDPMLVRSLATARGTFTYDSPKYVEAMLRLARSAGELADDPVVRVDIDVEVNEPAMQKILDQASLCVQNEIAQPFWWFSGSYCGQDGRADDPVNVYAVRQHWLVRAKGSEDRKQYVLLDNAKSFLVDLAEIGATQSEPIGAGRRNPARDPRLSVAARDIIARRGGRSKHRGTPQVISGAGLVASHHAIRRLPPFVNAPEMVVWIDDHLKRLLHEAIGDISRNSVERVPGAVMKQDRFPNGITPEDISRTAVYFRRLLNGCLMEAAIQDAEGRPAPLAEAVKTVVDAGVPDEQKLRQQLESAIAVRFDEVMHIWRNADYGNNLLKDWADRQEADKIAFRDSTVNAAVAYVALCRLWPQHVQAITSLLPHNAHWLFTKPHDFRAEATPLGEVFEPRPAGLGAGVIDVPSGIEKLIG